MSILWGTDTELFENGSCLQICDMNIIARMIKTNWKIWIFQSELSFLEAIVLLIDAKLLSPLTQNRNLTIYDAFLISACLVLFIFPISYSLKDWRLVFFLHLFNLCDYWEKYTTHPQLINNLMQTSKQEEIIIDAKGKAVMSILFVIKLERRYGVERYNESLRNRWHFKTAYPLLNSSLINSSRLRHVGCRVYFA